MFQTPVPDLGSLRRMLWTALAVSLLVALVLGLIYGPRLSNTLGDTDDAMRMALVQDLAHGRGWYDPSVARLQPPMGSFMHWTRLIDGGIAGLILLFKPLFGWSGAQLAARFLWPLLWIPPTVFSALVLARRLGGPHAVAPAAVLLMASLPLYWQFIPGRVDHHNAQITLCLIAAAGAVSGDRRSAAIAGLAIALGLAVGLESILFAAAICAAIALRFILSDRGRRPAIAFGAALALGAGTVFLIQTPPSRWGLAVCDAMGANLVLGLALGGLGLAGAAMACAKAGPATRAAAAGLAGVVALGAYLALDPNCRHGPMAEIDPRLYPIWLGKVEELMTWPQLYTHYPDHVFIAAATSLLSLGSLVFFLRRTQSRTDLAWLLVGGLLLLAIGLAASAARMESYLLWFAVPLLAAALAELSARKLRSALVPTLAVALAVSTAPMNVLAGVLFKAKAAQNAALEQADHCYDADAYRQLSALPPGLALSEIDIGPYILARTPHAILNAPYHRMRWGILSAEDALASSPQVARAKVEALHVTYVAACPAHAALFNHVRQPAGSLLRVLDADVPPPWLTRLSPTGAPLRIYRVN